METFWQDARYALRSMMKKSGFTAVVSLTLALGIGANTAIFSLIYGILLRPFPYADPDRLVKIESVYAKTTGSVQGASQLDLDDWQRYTKSFDNFGLHITYPAILNTGGGPSQSVRLTFVTARMFDTLGVNTIIGRNFKPEEDIVGGDVLKAVLSYGFWHATDRRTGTESRRHWRGDWFAGSAGAVAPDEEFVVRRGGDRFADICGGVNIAGVRCGCRLLHSRLAGGEDRSDNRAQG